MASTHHEQLADQLKEAAATYVSLWSNRKSLITVTDIKLTRKADKATFLVSVFPPEAQGPAIGFLMRKRGECHNYLKDHVSVGRVPHVEFVLDEGEKNRQRVEELLQQ